MSLVRRLFEGGAYLKGSYHKDKTFWLYNLIYFMGISMANRLEELKSAKILKRELNERASRYTHFELKNVTIDENKFPDIAGWEPHCSDYSVFLSSYGNTRISAALQLRRLLTFPLHVRRLIEGGAYSRSVLIRVNTVVQLRKVCSCCWSCNFSWWKAYIHYHVGRQKHGDKHFSHVSLLGRELLKHHSSVKRVKKRLDLPPWTPHVL